MTAIAIPVGLQWPYQNLPYFTQAVGTLDAAGEEYAMIGRLHINGRPAGTKTLDNSGSSAIEFQTSGTAVFDTAGSVFKVGIQGVTAAAGPIAQPDGTYGAVGVFTKGTNDTSPALTTGSSWTTAVPTTGSSTLSHGDLVAVVFELTTNNGAESIAVAGTSDGYYGGRPVTNLLAGAGPAWSTITGSGAGIGPNVVITFSDGTLATIDGMNWSGLIGNVSWATGGTDEKGMIFQVPFDCKVDALMARVRTAGATSDFTLSLYSDPFGTPAVMNSGAAAVTVLAEQCGQTNTALSFLHQLASEVSLTANTDYCVAVNADGAGNIRFEYTTIGNAAHRKLFSPAGDTIGGTSRSTGAFATATTLMYPIGVRISEISGFGAGGGMLVHPGMSGGMRG